MADPARDLTPTELELRLNQQGLVAALGLFALGARDLATILAEACRVAAQGLQTPFAKVLQPRPEGDLLVVAGVGWRPGVVGHARLGARLDSPAGYALHTGRPVLSNNLPEEVRFRTPQLLLEHGVQSAINVAIGVTEADPYGVLEVDSTARHEFEEADTAFLQSLANVVAAFVARQTQEEAARRDQALARQVFESSPDCIKILDTSGVLLDVNTNGKQVLDIADIADVRGRLWEEWWPEETRPLIRTGLVSATEGGVSRFTAQAALPGSGVQWWDVLVAPVMEGANAPRRLVAISRNVSDSVEAQRAKDALLRDKDLLMQEVHHRVKNSLQLVRTLLQLQARGASPEARAELDEAARRIMTIGAVHKRLYEGGSVAETDAASYVDALLQDLREMMQGEADARSLRLDAEPILLPADNVTPLGLVVSELVTNALKYGAGEMVVRLRRVETGLEVIVEDEGPGFPNGFDPRASGGLGMRLVTALAKGDPANAVRVDRSALGARIVVILTF